MAKENKQEVYTDLEKKWMDKKKKDNAIWKRKQWLKFMWKEGYVAFFFIGLALLLTSIFSPSTIRVDYVSNQGSHLMQFLTIAFSVICISVVIFRGIKFWKYPR